MAWRNNHKCDLKEKLGTKNGYYSMVFESEIVKSPKGPSTE